MTLKTTVERVLLDTAFDPAYFRDLEFPDDDIRAAIAGESRTISAGAPRGDEPQRSATWREKSPWIKVMLVLLTVMIVVTAIRAKMKSRTASADGSPASGGG